MDAVADKAEDKDDFALADQLSAISGVKVPKAVEEIRTAPVLHDIVVDAPDMPDTVKKFSASNDPDIWKKNLFTETFFFQYYVLKNHI